MERELTEMELETLSLVTCCNYVSFCKANIRETLFEWKGELLTPKTADKIMLSFGKIETKEDPRNETYKKFIKVFATYAMDDKEFVASLEE